MASVTDLRKVQKLLMSLRKSVDDSISVQKLQVLLAVAAEPGIEQAVIPDRCGLTRAAVSKNVANLSAINSKKETGPGVIRSDFDPMNLVARLLYLTPKGEKAIADAFAEAFGR